ncbi:amidohydrolase [Oceanidesulfovibrio indonesiensis]|uniref:Amidohydrolase n=1 Tax=Oceanidesulfovibrio indonesiensis TaxID=54767 RepID=A0A7M3MH55_9BACT|nr:amidohydrolase family protein [Oceanidesulfovibrio indonesiensis]TVM18819.1 amidohydrolase [Oceanidesulfovibrio indonesiensis]
MPRIIRKFGTRLRSASRSPIPTRDRGSDEVAPGARTPRQRELATRIDSLGMELSRRQGLSRREFLGTAAGMAAAFVAMNQTFGMLFDADLAEAADPARAAERADRLSDQLVIDMHTHFLRPDTRLEGFVALRELARDRGWNPDLQDKEQSLEDLMFRNYITEIYLKSDTTMACISGAPSEIERDWFLTNDMKASAREAINGLAGTRRSFAHAIFAPGYSGWMDQVEYAIETLKPDSFKGYTIGDNTHKNLSEHPWRMDDEDLVYPAYEKFKQAGLMNVCVHKGLFPPEDEERFPHLTPYCTVQDVPKAAKDWPELNFIIYHAGYRFVGGRGSEGAWEQFQKTGRIEWVTDLAEIPEKHGVNNVYADLGQTFAMTVIAEPRLAAVILGQLVKGLGADHVCWGSDALWTGAPQWQIEGLRRLEIPEDLREKYDLPELGGPDSGIKRAILGENNARLYGVDAEQAVIAMRHDGIARLKGQLA